MNTKRARWPWGGLVLMCFFMSACIYDGLVIGDETSFSRGLSRDGVLHRAARLPASGDGYRIPDRWSRRGLNFGVDELVSMIVSTGRTLQMYNRDLVLTVGDMSLEVGGRSQWHRSHQTGRDVDLLFFVRDTDGQRIVNETMSKHHSDGAELVFGKKVAKVVFDFEANWLLVKTLLNNPVVDVQYIFILDGLRQGLLEYASKNGESQEVILRASHILRQPGDSAPHDDHMHVRIYCPKEDVQYGCADFGQMRWHKRDLKYERRVERLKAYQQVLPDHIIVPTSWLF